MECIEVRARIAEEIAAMLESVAEAPPPTYSGRIQPPPLTPEANHYVVSALRLAATIARSAVDWYPHGPASEGASHGPRHGISIYLQHDTLTPRNVRHAVHDANAVPRVGDEIQGPLGYDGVRVIWVVKRVVWVGNDLLGRSVTLHCSGPTGEDRYGNGRAEE